MNYIKKHRKIILILFIFTLLRFLFLKDMVWQYDQIQLVDWINELYNEGDFKLIGMKSGANIINFGFCVWCFYLFGIFTNDPLGIVSIIVLLNIISILILYKVGNKIKDTSSKNIWINSLMFYAVSLCSILFCKIIWIQAILPFFTSIIVYFFLKRFESKWSLFGLGIFICLAAQVHLSGVFLAFSYFLFIHIQHYKYHKKINLKYFYFGIMLNIPLAYPLFEYYLINPIVSDNAPSSLSFLNILELRPVWYLIYTSLGIDITYHLGNYEFDFLKFPYINKTPTYIGLALYLAIVLITISGFYTFIKSNKLKMKGLLNLIFNSNFFNEYVFINTFSLFIMLIIGIHFHAHYFIFTYPLPFIILSIVFNYQTKLKVLLLTSMLLFSLLFLFFIRGIHGEEKYPFGKTYYNFIN